MLSKGLNHIAKSAMPLVVVPGGLDRSVRSCGPRRGCTCLDGIQSAISEPPSHALPRVATRDEVRRIECCLAHHHAISQPRTSDLAVAARCGAICSSIRPVRRGACLNREAYCSLAQRNPDCGVPWSGLCDEDMCCAG